MGTAIKPVRGMEEQDSPALGMGQRISEREVGTAVLTQRLSELDDLFITLLHRWSIPALRLALGVIFLWFGALKVAGVSPVLSLIKQTYSFLPLPAFLLLLSIWEMAIGCGLIFKRALRLTLVLLWMHLMGTFIALLRAPALFFLHSNLLCLTAEGEFVIKNLVIVAAGLVIGGYEVKPRARAERILQQQKGLGDMRRPD